MNAINALSRKANMLVITQTDGKMWSLNADLKTWTQMQFGAAGATGRGSVASGAGLIGIASGPPANGTTNASGSYTATITYSTAGSVTITPVITNTTFSPATVSETVTAYTGAKITISPVSTLTGGTATISVSGAKPLTAITFAVTGTESVGVTETGSGVTDASGNYSSIATFPTVGTVVFTPSVSSTTFSPTTATETVTAPTYAGGTCVTALIINGDPTGDSYEIFFDNKSFGIIPINTPSASTIVLTNCLVGNNLIQLKLHQKSANNTGINTSITFRGYSPGQPTTYFGTYPITILSGGTVGSFVYSNIVQIIKCYALSQE